MGKTEGGETSSLSDVDLMLRVRRGCEESFRELVERHKKTVINIAFRFTADEVVAEDIAQEVFFRIWEHRKSYAPSARFSTYLYRVTMNQCISEYRLRRRHREVHIQPSEDSTYFDLPSDADSPSRNIEENELAEQVKEAVSALPENQRMALILCKFENLPYAEIAAVMGISLEAVKALLVRARATLRRKLSFILKKEK